MAEPSDPRVRATAGRPLHTHRAFVSSAAVVLFIVLWEFAPRLGLVDPFYVSQPSRIASAGADIIVSGDLGRHVAVSLQEFLAGLTLAITIGVPGGLLLGAYRPLRLLFDPLVTALYAAPRLALLPILVVWLGIGMASKVAVVFIGAVLPIVINSAAGIRAIDASLVVAARSLGARRLDIFTKVLLPASLPTMMAGIRLGLGRGLLGVVVGEMYVSHIGVGHQIAQMGSAFRMDDLLFYTLLVSGFGVAVTSAVRHVEDRLRAGDPTP